jgi:hypothetical protein
MVRMSFCLVRADLFSRLSLTAEVLKEERNKV